MTTTTTRRTCSAIKTDGAPCGSWAVTGSVFCVVHDPAHAATVAAARQRGGRARHGRNIGSTGTSAPVTLRELADVLVLLERVCTDLYELENSVARGRALVSLAGVFVDSYKVTELERRLLALELRANNDTGSTYHSA